MILGISLGVPLILVITPRGQKTLYCVFFGFRDLYGLKLTGDFSRIIIFQNMTIRSFGIKQTEPGRGKEQGWRAHPLDAPPVLLATSGLPSSPSKVPEGSLDLKTPYIKVPDASRGGGGVYIRNTEIRPEPAT